MAKQLGYTDEDLDGIRAEDPPERFDAPVRAALRFAAAMTHDAHEVSDEVFAELREHFDEGQIVELACVVGLTNYFNRFTTGLRIDLSGSNAPYDEGPS